jgi:exonuclease SbcC
MAKNYQSQEHLLNAIVGREVELNGMKVALDKLQTLPAGFGNTMEFRLHIKSLRDELKQLGEELRRNWHEHDVKERELPEESYEELKLQYEIAGQELAKNLARAQTFMHLKEAFSDTLAAMDANSFQPLIAAFSKYLSQTTRGNYRLGRLDEHFNLSMIRQDEVRMPINLLSSGTYDSVALALRFALLEQIFLGRDGFVVLDDCLVDLDAARRGEAVNIIKEYARQNQVIFTTCSRETARLLGGNTIELG